MSLTPEQINSLVREIEYSLNRWPGKHNLLNRALTAIRQLQEAQTRAEFKADQIKAAALEAADEWREYVIEDNAPRGLCDYIERAIDTAIQTKEQGS